MTIMDKAVALTNKMINLIDRKEGDSFYLALSGGSSPLALFELWKGEYKDLIDWNKMKLFWVDERVVPPESVQSNFGVVRDILLKNVPIPNENVFRIYGENEPGKEAERYSKIVSGIVPSKSGFPMFDLIILGVGEDGHTASIFPGQEYLFSHVMPYAKSVNPYTGQNRVTMTGETILNSFNTYFYLRGSSKKEVVDRITSLNDDKFPASYFYKKLKSSELFWDTD